jgi:hypothetical protein
MTSISHSRIAQITQLNINGQFEPKSNGQLCGTIQLIVLKKISTQNQE